MIKIVEEILVGAELFARAAGEPKRDGNAWLLRVDMLRRHAPTDAIECIFPESVLRAGDELLSIQLHTSSESPGALWMDAIVDGASIARFGGGTPARINVELAGAVKLRIAPAQGYNHAVLGVFIRRARATKKGA